MPIIVVFEVLRFDYRGAGESTGNFANVSFPDWMRDLNTFAELLKNRNPAVPLLMSGLGLGSLLSANIFETGIGDALPLASCRLAAFLGAALGE